MSAGQALVVSEPGQVGLQHRDTPVPGPGELLVTPELIGMCGTDLEIIDGTIDPAYIHYPWSSATSGPGSPPPARWPAPASSSRA